MNRQAIKVFYGSTMMIRLYCSDCKAESLIIKGKFACCKRDARLEEVNKYKKKRETLSADPRARPPMKIRKKILYHQNYQCIYCGVSLRGKRKIEFDHFIPYSYSASDKQNFVASCRDCNSIKTNLLFNSIEEARIHLLERRGIKKLPIFNYYGGGYEVRKI